MANGRPHLKGLTSAVVAASIVAIWATIGCGGGEETTPTPRAPSPAAPQQQATATTRAPTVAVPQPTATPTQAPVPSPTVAGPQPTANPTKAPTPSPAKPSGNLVIATNAVGTANTNPQACTECWFLGPARVWDPLLNQVRAPDGNIVLEPGIAESWTINADGSSDLKIRRGVKYHGGWGEVTPEDVAFTFNIENTNIYKDSVNAIFTEFTNFLVEPVTVLPNGTVHIPWKTHPNFVELRFLTSFFKTQGVFPKKVWDEKGREWMVDHFVSTGPFQLEEWTTRSRMVLRAFPEHWEKVPFVDKVQILQVGENATRRAMLESGQAQIAAIDLKDWPALLKGSRFKQPAEGSVTNTGWIVGGNYWAKKHPETGAALQRQQKFELPWVGNPDDAAHMERARKVRLALATSIDREGINQAVLAGLGRPSYVGGIDNGDPVFQKKWEYPFNPAGAKTLLKDAGYPDGFTVKWYVEPGSVQEEIADAIAVGWQNQLNVKSDILRQPYGVYRPNYINRTSYELSNRVGGSQFPATWQEEWLISSINANRDGTAGGGFNAGIELDEASRSIAKKNAAKSEAEVIAAVNGLYDFIHDQAVWIGSVQWNVNSIYDTKAIIDWKRRPSTSTIHDLEWVKLAGQ